MYFIVLPPCWSVFFSKTNGATGEGHLPPKLTVAALARSSLTPCRTIAVVAYDEKLAERIRELMAGESDLTEKKMFGGLAFLIGGNMAVAASGQGGVLVRVDPEESESLVTRTDARVFEMRGRSMRGWLRVDSEHLRTKRQLAAWVERGTAYARSLPAKP
jgi:TfoX/Sxy family transcriptional regulator of competence genes